MMTIIDSDQHLYETRTLWAEHIDPAQQAEALSIVDDELGYPWLTWRDRLDIADMQLPAIPVGSAITASGTVNTSRLNTATTRPRTPLLAASPQSRATEHHGPRRGCGLSHADSSSSEDRAER